MSCSIKHDKNPAIPQLSFRMMNGTSLIVWDVSFCFLRKEQLFQNFLFLKKEKKTAKADLFLKTSLARSNLATWHRQFCELSWFT